MASLIAVSTNFLNLAVGHPMAFFGGAICTAVLNFIPAVTKEAGLSVGLQNIVGLASIAIPASVMSLDAGFRYYKEVDSTPVNYPAATPLAGSFGSFITGHTTTEAQIQNVPVVQAAISAVGEASAADTVASGNNNGGDDNDTPQNGGGSQIAGGHSKDGCSPNHKHKESSNAPPPPPPPPPPPSPGSALDDDASPLSIFKIWLFLLLASIPMGVAAIIYRLWPKSRKAKNKGRRKPIKVLENACPIYAFPASQCSLDGPDSFTKNIIPPPKEVHIIKSLVEEVAAGPLPETTVFNETTAPVEEEVRSFASRLSGNVSPAMKKRFQSSTSRMPYRSPTNIAFRILSDTVYRVFLIFYILLIENFLFTICSVLAMSVMSFLHNNGLDFSCRAKVDEKKAFDPAAFLDGKDDDEDKNIDEGPDEGPADPATLSSSTEAAGIERDTFYNDSFEANLPSQLYEHPEPTLELSRLDFDEGSFVRRQLRFWGLTLLDGVVVEGFEEESTAFIEEVNDLLDAMGQVREGNRSGISEGSTLALDILEEEDQAEVTVVTVLEDAATEQVTQSAALLEDLWTDDDISSIDILSPIEEVSSSLEEGLDIEVEADPDSDVDAEDGQDILAGLDQVIQEAPVASREEVQDDQDILGSTSQEVGEFDQNVPAALDEVVEEQMVGALVLYTPLRMLEVDASEALETEEPLPPNTCTAMVVWRPFQNVFHHQAGVPVTQIELRAGSRLRRRHRCRPKKKNRLQEESEPAQDQSEAPQDQSQSPQDQSQSPQDQSEPAQAQPEAAQDQSEAAQAHSEPA